MSGRQEGLCFGRKPAPSKKPESSAKASHCPPAGLTRPPLPWQPVKWSGAQGAHCQEGDRASAGLPHPGTEGTSACQNCGWERCMLFPYFPWCACVCRAHACGRLPSGTVGSLSHTCNWGFWWGIKNGSIERSFTEPSFHTRPRSEYFPQISSVWCHSDPRRQALVSLSQRSSHDWLSDWPQISQGVTNRARMRTQATGLQSLRTDHQEDGLAT